MAKPKEAGFIAARLRELRQATGLTQEQFAERSGINYKVYQNFESGRRWNLELKTVIRLAAEHDLTLIEFFTLGAKKTRRSPQKPR
jgi:transcriptional regulator with XRE-family HTH domain